MKKMTGCQWLATLGGAGLLPKAPGTAGSLVSLPFFWALSHVGFGVYGLVLLALLPLSIWSAQRAGMQWAHADDQRIVIDEMMGLGIACWGLLPGQYFYFGVAFLVFRLFDIVKPWPACYFDRQVKNGFGVVMDDVVAGAYAWGGVALIKWLWSAIEH